MPEDATGGSTESTGTLPDAVVDEAERLTKLARDAVDDGEARAYRDERDDLLAAHDFEARVREESAGDDATLVCYPTEWMADGVVQLDSVQDVDRGVERRLEGSGDEEWEVVATRNEAIVDRVASEYDDPHVSTARALADFANNHYAKPIPALTSEEVREFETEYFPRNAWPNAAQTDALEDSLEVIFEKVEAASGDPP